MENCAYCKLEGPTYTCGNQCGSVLYCGQACADADYGIHVKECQIGAILTIHRESALIKDLREHPDHVKAYYQEYLSKSDTTNPITKRRVTNSMKALARAIDSVTMTIGAKAQSWSISAQDMGVLAYYRRRINDFLKLKENAFQERKKVAKGETEEDMRNLLSAQALTFASVNRQLQRYKGNKAVLLNILYAMDSLVKEEDYAVQDQLHNQVERMMHSK